MENKYPPAIDNIDKIIKTLEEEYPDSTDTTLDYNNPFQLLIATILAAQSTDKLVNKVTPKLFKKYRKPEDFANAELEELQKDIKSTGFFRNKAKSIKNCSRDIAEKFQDNVPQNLDDLTSLPGVGRKTANVVLGNAFKKQAIIVDTHMKRISRRLGLTTNSDPTKIEFDLMNLIPKDKWTDFSHKIVSFGRTICLGRNPKCNVCNLLKYCRFGQENA